MVHFENFMKSLLSLVQGQQVGNKDLFKCCVIRTQVKHKLNAILEKHMNWRFYSTKRFATVVMQIYPL